MDIKKMTEFQVYSTFNSQDNSVEIFYTHLKCGTWLNTRSHAVKADQLFHAFNDHQCSLNKSWRNESDDFRKLMRAYARLHPSMIDYVTWYISENKLRGMAKDLGMDLPPGQPLPESWKIFDIPIEIVESREILLVMKVTGE